MSEKDEEFRYSLKIVDSKISNPTNLSEAFGQEMEEMMFKSLEHISIHNDDPAILLEWFESSGPWPERPLGFGRRHAQNVTHGSVVVGDTSTRYGAATFRLTTLGEHDLLDREQFREYFDQHHKFIGEFWHKWKDIHNLNSADVEEAVYEVMCDAFVEAGGQPVPTSFWEWLGWYQEVIKTKNIMKALYPEETIPKALMAQFPSIKKDHK